MAVAGNKLLEFSGSINVCSATKDINIKTDSDKFPCRIIDCAVVASDKLVLADCNNNKLKVLDTQSNLIIVEKQLDSSPWDVAVLPQDQIAVNLPEERVILITDTKLSTVHTIPVNNEFRSITFHQNYLYAVSKNLNNVSILDTKGTVHNTISLDTGKLKNPYYIVVNKDSELMYISFPETECIMRITLQGEISAVYKVHLKPTGMTVLDDGSLLVCCTTGTIYHISSDLKQVKAIKSGLQEPWSICYIHQQRKVYIGGFGHDRLKVFNLTYV